MNNYIIPRFVPNLADKKDQLYEEGLYQIFEKDYKLGNITKKNYESVKTGKISVYDLNSYQCNYCRYFKNFETGESTCLNTTNETK